MADLGAGRAQLRGPVPGRQLRLPHCGPGAARARQRSGRAGEGCPAHDWVSPTASRPCGRGAPGVVDPGRADQVAQSSEP
ncbi:MAG TPA: hypothetical protein DHU96_18945, partial [Actinobacteria bacterium]|nr:hypothetical protein [Actinomycetota bacterium]